MQTVTQSGLRTFRNCQMRYYWQYERRLEPMFKHDALTFGSLIHDALEAWHNGADIDDVIEQIRAASTMQDIEDVATAKAIAMMRGYAECYPSEEFNVIALEREFQSSIVNPTTGRLSRTFRFAGKADGLVQFAEGDTWLLEHKTAATVDDAYRERLWLDPQIALYSAALMDKYQMCGIVYNVLEKCKLRQKKNETFDEYAERLVEWHLDPAHYYRFEIHLTIEQIRQAVEDLWTLSKQIRQCQRSGAWAHNPYSCHVYHSMCPFFELCRSGGDETTIDNLYTTRENQHQELSQEVDK